MAAPRTPILVVDDDFDLRETLREVLEDRGFHVDTASDGGAALDHLRKGHRPAVILLDLMMPKTDGYAFRREQLADPKLKDLSVVVMTASGRPEQSMRKDLGAVTFMRKPFDIDDLVATIEKHIVK